MQSSPGSSEASANGRPAVSANRQNRLGGRAELAVSGNGTVNYSSQAIYRVQQLIIDSLESEVVGMEAADVALIKDQLHTHLEMETETVRLALENLEEQFRVATAIRDSILAGADFGDMAVRHSEDPSASNATGRQGYRGALPSGIADAIAGWRKQGFAIDVRMLTLLGPGLPG